MQQNTSSPPRSTAHNTEASSIAPGSTTGTLDDRGSSSSELSDQRDKHSASGNKLEMLRQGEFDNSREIREASSHNSEQASSAEPLQQPAPGPPSNPSLDDVPHFSEAASQAAAELVNLVLPSDSPPVHRDLFVHSVFSTVALTPSAKPVARLEAVIHTSPDKLKEFLTDFGSSSAASKGVNAVVQERKENGEYIVTYKIQGNEVRRRAHGRML